MRLPSFELLGPDNVASILSPYFLGASLHRYHLSESTVSRDRSTASAVVAAIDLLHPLLGHQGSLGNLQNPMG